MVDFPRTANQSNLGNDVSQGATFTVQGVTALKADLVPQSISVSPNPATAGGSVTVSYNVANTGGTAAPGSQTKIQIKNSGGVVITQPTFAAPAVNANANSPLQASVVSIPAGTPAGNYTAIVILDNQSQLNQSN